MMCSIRVVEWNCGDLVDMHNFPCDDRPFLLMQLLGLKLAVATWFFLVISVNFED